MLGCSSGYCNGSYRCREMTLSTWPPPQGSLHRAVLGCLFTDNLFFLFYIILNLTLELSSDIASSRIQSQITMLPVPVAFQSSWNTRHYSPLNTVYAFICMSALISALFPASSMLTPRGKNLAHLLPGKVYGSQSP